MRGKNKPDEKLVYGRPSRMWFGVKASVSVGSEEKVVSGLELLTASTLQAKVEKFVIQFPSSNNFRE